MNFFDLNAEDSVLKRYPLEQHRGQVVLVVNVASKCGFTPQYKDLQSLYEMFKDQGLVILGFPCNQFGSQEPGDNQDIQQFCGLTYNVTFPVLNKVEVNGNNTHPIYKFLKSEAPGVLGTEVIKWNFTKFLVGKDGAVKKRYSPQTSPIAIADDIKHELES